MSEKNVIVRLLQSAERRARLNRVLDTASSTLAISLLIPVGFKISDLISPFRGTTIVIFLGLWAASTIAWIVWKSRGRDPLEKIAAAIDEKSDTHDEIRSAYWFIRHPKDSGWVDALIERATITATRVKPDKVFPRRIPKRTLSVAGLVLFLGLLNFIPLSWNHNWLLLQGAPAYALSDAQQEILKRAMELLQKAEQLQDNNLAAKLAQLIQALRDGSMSQSQLTRSLADIQQALADRKLDAARITDGLERIAKALEPFSLTKPIANPLFALDLKSAAAQTLELESKLEDTPQDLQRMAERFQEGADVAGKGLEPLSQLMKNASDTMRRRDSTAAKQSLDQVAKEFERLQRVLDSQKLNNAASDQLSALKDSVEGRPGEVAGGEGQGEAQLAADGKGQGEGVGQGEGEGEGVGQGEGEGQGQGEGEGEGQGEGLTAADGTGQGDGTGPPGGHGVGLSGPLPARGAPTSLEVQLQKEGIPIQPTRGSRPESIDEASQRERSKLDYRNIPSELSPAKKDSLHQTTVPTEQRQLIQKYFENLRKPQ